MRARAGEEVKLTVTGIARAGFLLTMAVLVVSGWLSYRNVRELSLNEKWVVHTYQVLEALRDTLTSASEAESGQRGFILTGDKAYLEPYYLARAASKSDTEKLAHLVSDNPPQQRRAANLAQLLEARYRTLEQGIAARTSSSGENAVRVILSGRGKEEMDAVRVVVAEMEKTELGLLRVRQAESQASLYTVILTISVTTLLGLALIATAYALTVRETKTRRHGVEALARANDELESRVKERTADLAATNESLQRSNRELEQFASVASHDLQEPLRKIQAFGDRLQTRCGQELGEQGRDYLKRMQASAARMRNLIDALLTFSRVTTKAQPFAPVDLALTAEDVVADLENQADTAGGRIEVGGLPTIEADPLQMRQLLQNLIGNGLKFARANEPPIVQVASRMLESVSEQEDKNGACCEISVRDNGIGFEEIYLDRIFELFQRLHGRQEYEGTGMGLAICRKIVERHGGSITARSAPGAGATFLVTLPLRQQ
jgi:signal transduction histidine kinase